MPLELQIIKAAEFIKVGAHGRPDIAASREVLRQLAGACKKRGIDRALLDMRCLLLGPKPVFSPADLLAVVNAFPEMGFRKGQRLAVLYTNDRFNRVKMFAFIGTLHGWSVRAFGDYEAAINWLMSTLGEDTEQMAGEEIPVRLAKGVKEPRVKRLAVQNKQQNSARENNTDYSNRGAPRRHRSVGGCHGR